MFSLYSDLPAPKNASSSSTSHSAPVTPAATLARTVVPNTEKSTPTPQTPTPASTPQTPAASGWNSKLTPTAGDKGTNLSSAFAQSVLLKKKRLAQQKTPVTPRISSASVSSTITAHPLDETPSSQHTTWDSAGPEDVPAKPKAISIFAKEGEIIYEMYDPVVPNDYEDWAIERQVIQERRRREEEEERAQEQRRKKAQQQESFGFSYQNPSPPRREDRDDYDPEPYRAPPPVPTPAAPPANIDLNISGEEAWRRRAQLTAQIQGPAALSPSPMNSGGGNNNNNNNNDNNPKNEGGLSVAERMMKKMGWTEGQGLGAQGQGMRNPLIGKKTRGRGPGTGVIVGGGASGPPSKMPKREFTSRVILLRNMVGPGEVDDELEGETASECEKYGRVIRCAIHEERGPSVPPTKAVRIFVQFAETNSASKALTALNGRFFAKRTVEATYFDEERFAAGELAARPDEL